MLDSPAAQQAAAEECGGGGGSGDGETGWVGELQAIVNALAWQSAEALRARLLPAAAEDGDGGSGGSGGGGDDDDDSDDDDDEGKLLAGEGDAEMLAEEAALEAKKVAAAALAEQVAAMGPEACAGLERNLKILETRELKINRLGHTIADKTGQMDEKEDAWYLPRPATTDIMVESTTGEDVAASLALWVILAATLYLLALLISKWQNMTRSGMIVQVLVPIFFVTLNGLITGLKVGYAQKLASYGEEMDKVKNQLNFWDVDCPYDSQFATGLQVLKHLDIESTRGWTVKQVRNRALRIFYGYIVASRAQLVAVFVISLVFAGIPLMVRGALEDSLAYKVGENRTIVRGLAQSCGASINVNDFGPMLFSPPSVAGVQGANSTEPGIFKPYSSIVDAKDAPVVRWMGQCWWEQHISFFSLFLTFYLFSRFLFECLFSYHAMNLVLFRARLFAALTSIDLSRKTKMPWLNTMSKLDSLDGWIKIRHAVKNLMSPKELLLCDLYIKYCLFIDLLIVLILVICLYGLNRTVVMSALHEQVVGWALIVLFSGYLFFTMRTAAAANAAYADNSTALTTFQYDQGYLIRRDRARLSKDEDTGDGHGGGGGGSGGGVAFMSYGLGSKLDEIESRRNARRLEECREAMGEIAAISDREGAEQQITIAGFPITTDFLNWLVSLCVTALGLMVAKYFEFLNPG